MTHWLKRTHCDKHEHVEIVSRSTLIQHGSSSQNADCWVRHMCMNSPVALCLMSGLWLFNTLFPEWKCVTQEKEILSARLSTLRPLRSYRSRLIHRAYSKALTVPVHIGLLHTISTDPSSSLWQTASVRSLGVAYSCARIQTKSLGNTARDSLRWLSCLDKTKKTKPNKTVMRIQYIT